MQGHCHCLGRIIQCHDASLCCTADTTMTYCALYPFRGNPNMNSLIGLGALTSFAAGVAAPLVPGMAFDASFLEEPVMLLAFVLLGRSLEARARVKASGGISPLTQSCTFNTLRTSIGQERYGRAANACVGSSLFSQSRAVLHGALCLP